jgi:hypothetical protein
VKQTIESKGAFARRMGRGASAVSNWISLGKITPAALIGKGNAAKIWVERAQADLAGSLDPSQQLMQDSPILPPASPSATLQIEPDQSKPAPSDVTRPVSADIDRAMDLARRAKADANIAEYNEEAARRKLLVDEGKYIVAEDAAREWARAVAKLMSEIETFMSTTLSRKLAEKHGLDWKALTVEMRNEFRSFRGNLSEDARKRREAIETEAPMETA